MKWQRGTQNPDVIDARGRKLGPGAKIGIGGIAVTVVVMLISQALGVDLSGLIGQGGGAGGGGQPVEHTPAPPDGHDPDAELVDFVNSAMKSIQDTFDTAYQQQGRTYRRAKLVLFTAAVDTGCGRSSSAIGPFYCPADQHAYIDLSFFRDLAQRFNAPGDFAQAYVLAHEIGHHVQTISGIEQITQRMGRDERSRNAASVRQELQADCYAGVWGHFAAKRGDLELGDLEEALRAASAIGDDRLAKQAGQDINPETFTHGTSEQRMTWFRRGFDSGSLGACDTFSQSNP